jgi:hypothetical protein
VYRESQCITVRIAKAASPDSVNPIFYKRPSRGVLIPLSSLPFRQPVWVRAPLIVRAA